MLDTHIVFKKLTCLLCLSRGLQEEQVEIDHLMIKLVVECMGALDTASQRGCEVFQESLDYLLHSDLICARSRWS